MGCHELPAGNFVHYYVLNNGQDNESFNYFDKDINVEIDIKGYGYVFAMGLLKGVYFELVANIKNQWKNDLRISFENIELQSNYYKYTLVDTLQKLESNTTRAKELKLLFRSSGEEDIKDVPMDDILILKLKLFIEGNKLDLPEVIFSPQRRS